MSGERVFIVEDNSTAAKLIAYLLRAYGYEVTVANNADQALASIREQHPDVIRGPAEERGGRGTFALTYGRGTELAMDSSASVPSSASTISQSGRITRARAPLIAREARLSSTTNTRGGNMGNADGDTRQESA